MGEMVDRVAKGYANAWSADIKTYLDTDVPVWDQMGEQQRAAMIRVTRAAMKEMRNLTDDMLMAALDAAATQARTLIDRLPEKARIPALVVVGHGSIYQKAYQAAIDEALK